MIPLLRAVELPRVLFCWYEFRGLEFVLTLDIHLLLRLYSENKWQFNSSLKLVSAQLICVWSYLGESNYRSHLYLTLNFKHFDS